MFGCLYSILALVWHAQLSHHILAHDLFLAGLAHAGNVSVRAIERRFMQGIFTQKPNQTEQECQFFCFWLRLWFLYSETLAIGFGFGFHFKPNCKSSFNKRATDVRLKGSNG